jgi:predicted DNA binding CopG/RHH family protein
MKKLPRFRSAAEEARFWATHSPLNYPDEFKEVDSVFVLAPELARKLRERMSKRLFALRLEQWQIERAKEIARAKGIPYQRLMREWIGQGIRSESAALRRRAQ